MFRTFDLKAKKKKVANQGAANAKSGATSSIAPNLHGFNNGKSKILVPDMKALDPFAGGAGDGGGTEEDLSSSGGSCGDLDGGLHLLQNRRILPTNSNCLNVDMPGSSQ